MHIYVPFLLSLHALLHVVEKNDHDLRLPQTNKHWTGACKTAPSKANVPVMDQTAHQLMSPPR